MTNMAKYMICICGWVSEEYPDNWMPIGLGGVLDCPICHAQQRNATLEMCYGHVSVVTLKELKMIREFEARDIPWEKAISLYHEIKIWEGASVENLAKTYEKLETKSIHCHLAWFGSELACKECNPVCYKNHQMGNPNHLKWCGEEKCPINPERFKKPTFPVTYNQELADYLSSPREGVSPREKKEIKKGLDALKTEEAKPFVPVIRSRSDECWEEEEELEAKEDAIRMSKRKSIRKGGKYKERGKEKRREP